MTSAMCKVLERFAFVEVPAERAGQVAEAVYGNEVRGTSSSGWR